jgi:cytochrome oxidase Cu insertion factor (SCO1/SenC/PrrC family)
MDCADMTESQAHPGRRQLILMLVIAAVSLGGSWLLFFASQEGVWGTTNKGAFVSPPVNSADLHLADARGVDHSGDGVWWLWVVQDRECNQACDAALHQMRQLHVLLNRDADRVHRALLTSAPIPGEALLAKYPGLRLFSGSIDPLAAGIYIVDPHGNLVLHYPLDMSGKSVLADLKRLLKVSQIG